MSPASRDKQAARSTCKAKFKLRSSQRDRTTNHPRPTCRKQAHAHPSSSCGPTLTRVRSQSERSIIRGKSAESKSDALCFSSPASPNRLDAHLLFRVQARKTSHARTLSSSGLQDTSHAHLTFECNFVRQVCCSPAFEFNFARQIRLPVWCQSQAP